MKATQKYNQQRLPHTTLYRHIFYGRFTSVVVLVLLTSFLLQPIERARASEAPSVPEKSAPINTSVETADVPGDEVSAPIVTNTFDSVPEQGSEEREQPERVIESPDTGSGPPELDVDFVEVETVSDLDKEEGSSIEHIPPVLEALSPLPDVPTDTELSGDVIDAIQSSSSVATTTGEIITATSVVQSDAQIQFDKSDCVAVADGSYYCRAKVVAESTVRNGLFAQPDADGDLEIFFARDALLQQVSFNQVDDASPYYDAISDTIVWHRLIDDRYQIISYDVRSGSESQLTTDSVNNMEPTRVGTFTVWQHWNIDNWDIMLYDGVTIRLLTDTPQHDIAPAIRSNLVIWNRLTSENVQTIELFDLTTGEYTTINDTEGGALSNPRMVLVYEAQFENGDVITKGYDVVTGEISALSSIPAALPETIPDPDQTGETRALIQGKTSSKEEGDQPLTPDPKIDPPTPNATSTASTTAALTLDLRSGTSTGTSVVATASSVSVIEVGGTIAAAVSGADIIVPSFIPADTAE